MQKSYYRLNNRIYSIYNSAKPHKKTYPNRCELSMLQAVDNFYFTLLLFGHFWQKKAHPKRHFRSIFLCFFAEIHIRFFIVVYKNQTSQTNNLMVQTLGLRCLYSMFLIANSFYAIPLCFLIVS